MRYNLESELAVKLNTADDKQIGLIAQEVKEVLPEVVNSPEEGYSSVNYSRLSAVLIEAVKELRAKNEARKSVENPDNLYFPKRAGQQCPALS